MLQHFLKKMPEYKKRANFVIYPETYFQPPFSPQSVWGIIEAVIFSTFYGEYL